MNKKHLAASLCRLNITAEDVLRMISSKTVNFHSKNNMTLSVAANERVSSAQEERLQLIEHALKLRASKMKAKSEAAHLHRQNMLKERMQRKRLLIERSRLEGLRRLWRRRNQICQSLAKSTCAANKLRSKTSLQLVVPPARDGYCPPDPFTSLSAYHLAYTEARRRHCLACSILFYSANARN